MIAPRRAEAALFAVQTAFKINPDFTLTVGKYWHVDYTGCRPLSFSDKTVLQGFVWSVVRECIDGRV